VFAGPSEIEKPSAWRRPRLLDIDDREPSTKQAISRQQMERRLTFGQPHKLFDTRLAFSFLTDQYAITSDGQRFLIMNPFGDGRLPPFNVVNWRSLLPR
jgi:hypothetical protein